jgi:hypothetical protein
MFNSFFRGMSRASRSVKLILLLHVINILFTLPISLPIFILLANTGRETLAVDKLVADKIDINWITDLVNQQFSGASIVNPAIQVGTLALVMGISYLLANTLFAGGILGVMVNGGQFSMRVFWSGCGTYFWRFLRLFVISLFFYGVVGLVYFLARRPIERAALEATEYQSIVYKRWAILLMLVLLFAFVNMIFDYARIITVFRDSRSMLRETLRAVWFAIRYFFSAYPLYLMIAIVGVSIFLGLATLRALIDQSSWATILGAFFLGQIAIASRIWTRVTFFAAELELYQRKTRSNAHNLTLGLTPEGVSLPESFRFPPADSEYVHESVPDAELLNANSEYGRRSDE